MKQLINIGTKEAVNLAYKCIQETPRKIDTNIHTELEDLAKKVGDSMLTKLNFLQQTVANVIIPQPFLEIPHKLNYLI